MKLICDTCAVINAFKAGALDVVLTLEGYTFVLSPAVSTESVQLREEIQKHVNSGNLVLPDETLVPAVTVESISGAYNLGIGESECIAICQADRESIFWSDDRRAKAVAVSLLGVERVVGTADLLRSCISVGLTPLDAYTAYELARSRGAFLPPLNRDFFQI